MKRGYTVCFRKAFGDAANTQTYIVRASFVRLTRLLRAVATKLLNLMKKLVISLLLPVAVMFFSGCASTTSEDEEPTGIGTTVRASACFSEVGSTEPLSTLVVGKTYDVNFAPFNIPSIIDFVRGSVTKVTYVLELPYKGRSVIGVSEKEPFTIQYTPTEAGTGRLTPEVELSSNDHNKWVEVETIVTIEEAGQ